MNIKSTVRTWLRKNGVGLVAIALLVPATVAITFANELGVYNAARPTQARDVAAGDVAQFAGTGWELQDVRRIGWSSDEGVDAGLPNATQLVVVTIRVTPDQLSEEGLSPFCSVRLDELEGTAVTRSWSDAMNDPIYYRAGEGVESYCTSELVTPYLMESIFVVPSDVGDNLAMQVQVEQELPRYLSLRL